MDVLKEFKIQTIPADQVQGAPEEKPIERQDSLKTYKFTVLPKEPSSEKPKLS
jgi:hypothetical protein